MYLNILLEESLLPLLKEVVPKKNDGVLEKSKDYIFATDGPNGSGFYLTWQREDGTEERSTIPTS